MNLILFTPVLPERLLQMNLLFFFFLLLFFLYKAKSVHMCLSTCRNAPVVNILVTCQRQGKIFIFTLAQNKNKFEQKGFGEKDKRWHTIRSQREKVINIPVVDIYKSQ